ncbi:MAG: DUF962 domain-containing protein [Flavobacteriia bacterium]|nr:DUF962 domain-containing protein [Flavobacteriia bacterium]OIP47101.1 MAG: hypothetical protein AUK46_06235 [Flavobacteriaceae bacterium CG2_30_31_66]PIV96437.1 MAG: hypothetical protein COW43_08470 [Flavobacteriaceae bacterium CG17_big_fil_post_rev_8_21_14_2_50_31_13]PIX14723.1 MAG: hypothetical protein COZ74_02080 [Flavobacteriaceae bacterium CG_4_8_14_3_um_filter_31_8]PIY14263.1 MAG: hypothetical protein COZ16_10040 [Flavobacteriaceae bacterium CG_4_10_14_3_um_filter_31_253]PIZ11423.1 MA
MRTAQEYFDEYALSHQNKTNIAIHYLCVPLIFFSVIGLLMSIPTTFLENLFGLYNPLLENWAIVIGALLSIFYMRLGFWYFAQMLFVILLCVVLNFWLSNLTNLQNASLSIFIIAWLGQFYGHRVEGVKPSFLKDLQFLLIGPLWVIQKIGAKN